MKEYLKSAEEVLKDTNSTQNGITSSQAKERLEKNGANKLKEPPRDGLLKKIYKIINGSNDNYATSSSCSFSSYSNCKQ